MQSFEHLPSEGRWARSAYVGGFAFKDTVAGERIWRTDPALRQHFTDLQTFTSMTPEALGRAIGQDKADAVIAYLRANPQALRPPTPASLAVAREKLAQRSEEHTSELQSLMRISYAVFCLKKKTNTNPSNPH